MNSKAVIYCRVSTREQRVSGLGLEAQEDYCRNYCLVNLIDVLVVLTETISGTVKLEERPVFINALNICNANDAILLVAKQDRLSRDELIWHGLNTKHTFGKKSTPKIVIAETPNATPFELSIRAAIGAEERRLISERTKASLARAKERGTELGKAGREAYVAKYGIPEYTKLLIINMHKKRMTYKKIVKELIAQGITRNDGSNFNETTVSYIVRQNKKNPIS